MSFLRKQLQASNGQALLIVVLIMVVGLTVTLSLVSRSIVNLKTSVDQTNSQKALAAAEAGVEQSIKNSANIGSSTTPKNFTNNASFYATYTQVAGNTSFLANGGNLVSKNEGTYIWLSTYDTTPWSDPWTGDLTIYWGDTSGDSTNSALEISVISGANPASAVIKRYAIDPLASRGNNFTVVAGANKGSFPIGSRTFGYKYTLSVTTGLLVRINPIYFSTYLGVLGSIPLPDQGTIITANGAAADTRRRITVFQGYPQLPAEFFPYSLLSP